MGDQVHDHLRDPRHDPRHVPGYDPATPPTTPPAYIRRQSTMDTFDSAFTEDSTNFSLASQSNATDTIDSDILDGNLFNFE